MKNATSLAVAGVVTPRGNTGTGISPAWSSASTPHANSNAGTITTRYPTILPSHPSITTIR
jgi:hypothetical protein